MAGIVIVIIAVIAVIVVIGILAGIVTVIAKSKNKHTPRKPVTALIPIIVVVAIVIGAAFLAIRVFVTGPDVTKVVDNITKETQFTKVKGSFMLDSVFGKASVSDGSIYMSKVRYADVTFNSDFDINKISGRQFINNVRIYGKVGYADLQKILKHLEQTYGAPYKLLSEDLENGYIGYENFADQTVKETTCIYPLDAADSAENTSDIVRLFHTGNYIMLDIVEEKLFGESYYTCQIEWCFTDDVNWGNRGWSDDNPNISYLWELAGFDD